MNINFEITDDEADIIAAQYGFDGKSKRDEFVLEQFKKFGRDCITSFKSIENLKVVEAQRKTAIDSIKASISF